MHGSNTNYIVWYDNIFVSLPFDVDNILYIIKDIQ